MLDPKRIQQRLSTATGRNLNEEDMKGIFPKFPEVSMGDLALSGAGALAHSLP
jgi:hypothetical protein